MKFFTKSRPANTPNKGFGVLFAVIFSFLSITVFSQSGEKWATGGNSINVNSFFGTLNSFPINFKTNNAQRMTLTPAGFLGLGTPAPTVMFECTGDGKINNFNVLFNQTIGNALSVAKIFSPTGTVDFDGSKISTSNEIIAGKVTTPKIWSAGGLIDFDGCNLTTTAGFTGSNLSISGNGKLGSVTANSFQNPLFAGANNGLILSDANGSFQKLNFDGNHNSYLRGDGTFSSLSGTSTWDTIYANAIIGGYVNATKSIQLDGSITAGSRGAGTIGEYSIVVGGPEQSLGFPTASVASGKYSVSFGAGNESTNIGSMSFGGGNISSGLFSFTIGVNNISSGNLTVAIGSGNTVTGSNTTVTGKGNIADGKQSAIIGGTGNTLSIGAMNSAIIGGEGITATQPNTVYVPNLVSTGNVGIGVENPIEKLDVDGNANIRGYLYVQDGVIIGKRITSEKVTSDTISTSKLEAIEKISTKEFEGKTLSVEKVTADTLKTDNMSLQLMQADSITAQKMTLNKLATSEIEATVSIASKDIMIGEQARVGSNIIIDGITNNISTPGDVTAGNFNAGNLRIFGTSSTIQSSSGNISFENTNLSTSGNIFAGNVGIGTDNPVEKLDVNGNANIRGYLYVQDGVIIGQRIYSDEVNTRRLYADTMNTDKITTDTLNVKEIITDSLRLIKLDISNLIKAKNIESVRMEGQTFKSDSLTSLNVTTETLSSRLINADGDIGTGWKITINGTNNTITSTFPTIGFGSNNLKTTGDITAGNFYAGNITANNLNLSFGSFNDLEVLNNLLVGNTTLNEYGLNNNSGDLLLQSSMNNTNNTIINNSNNGNVGIGTNAPQKKLHVRTYEDNTSDNPIGTDEESTGSIRIEHQLGNLPLSTWDLEPIVSGSGSTRFSIGTPARTDMFTIKSNGNVGIGTHIPDATLHVKGTLKLEINTANSGDILAYDDATGNVMWKNPNQVFSEKWENGTGDNENDIFRTNGKVGIGTSTPSEKLHIKNGSIYIDGESCGLIVNENGGKRVGFMKYLNHEAGIWRVQDQDFEIGRLNNVSMLPGNPAITDFLTDLYITTDGKVGIGTTTPSSTLSIKDDGTFGIGAFEILQKGNIGNGIKPQFRLVRHNSDNSTNNICSFDYTTNNIYDMTISGIINCNEVNITDPIVWPDYVFTKTYKLKSLKELEEFISKNQHLPDVPSAINIKNNGIKLGDMSSVLLKKIEELTLYIIEQQKSIDKQNLKIQQLEEKFTGTLNSK